MKCRSYEYEGEAYKGDRETEPRKRKDGKNKEQPFVLAWSKK